MSKSEELAFFKGGLEFNKGPLRLRTTESDLPEASGAEQSKLKEE